MSNSGYQRLQDARSQRAQLFAERARRLLCHGSWVSRFRMTLHNESDRRIHCDLRQDKHEFQTYLIVTHRRKHGLDLRSIGATQWVLCRSTLHRESASHSLQRLRARKDSHILAQQFCSASIAACRALQESLAGRIMLQMDQTIPWHQDIFLATARTSFSANLLCRGLHDLMAIVKKGTSNCCFALYFAADIIGVSFEKT